MDLTFLYVAVNNLSIRVSSLSDICSIIDIKLTSNTVWRSDLFLKFSYWLSKCFFLTPEQRLICRRIWKCNLHRRVCLLKASHAPLLEQEKFPLPLDTSMFLCRSDKSFTRISLDCWGTFSFSSGENCCKLIFLIRSDRRLDFSTNRSFRNDKCHSTLFL